MSQPSTNSPHLMLSTQDVERLLTEETPDARIDVLKKVAEAHIQNKYSANELLVAEQIFRVLVKDTEISVREALALALKDSASIPRDIIAALLKDVDSVALPVIEYSTILSDEELIALIQSAKNTLRPVAAARRKKISEKLSLALIETENTKAVSQLVKNHNAAIADDAYQQILRNYAKNPEIMAAVAERPGLPVTVVEKIITLVSDALAEKLRITYKISPATIAAETEKTREIATLKLVDGPINPTDVEKLVDQLRVFGRLTPSIILTSLCRGNLYFFETSLARLSNVPVRNAQLLIHDKGGLGFKALYGKAGLPDKFFLACQLLLNTVAEMQRAKQPINSNVLVQNLIGQSAGKNIDNLSYIIALIRQNA